MNIFRVKGLIPRNPRYAVAYLVAFLFAAGTVALAVYSRNNELKQRSVIGRLESANSELQGKIAEINREIDTLRKEDQRVKNDELSRELKNIQTTYADTVKAYEELLKVKELTPKTEALDKQFSLILTYLSQKNYASASTALKNLSQDTQKLRDSISASFAIPSSVPLNNTPPETGYSRQTVSADTGNYLVDMVSADLAGTRVIVDSASDSDCRNDCPVMPLADYVRRNGGYAGINGSYFCPATYPSCADKKNSFDTLLMNVRKFYLNSDNNVYSTVPLVVFLGSSVRFVSQSLDWGRDTGNDGVLANQPMLLAGGTIVFGGDGDPKKGSKGPRSFVANRGNTVYIGVVHNATVAEAAHVVKALGMENALNLDSGGSTALYSGGYKVGPGRNIPNAIVFVKR